jgi:SNF2 family DNA or RNA helicase
MKVAESGLLANEPGTGKTVTTTTAARMWHLEDESSLPMLVVCPNSVKTHWVRHFKQWFPEAHPYNITGGAVTRRKLLEEAMGDPLAAVIINIESVRLHSRLAPHGAIRFTRCVDCGGEDERVKTSRCDVHLKELNSINFKMVVVDEAHRIKDPKSKQTRACMWMMHAPGVKHSFALTGTPIANHIGDLQTVMRGVAPSEFDGRSKFLDRYALFTWQSAGGLGISDVNPATRDELFRFLHPRMRRMLTAIVLPNLPPKEWSVRESEMLPRQEKAYKEIKRHLFTRLEDGRMLVATNNLVKNIRLIQLASACAEIEMIEEGDAEKWIVRLVDSPKSPKIDILEEVVEENEGRQIAVCAMSRQLIELAAARLESKGHRVAQITGKVNQWDRDTNLADFQAGRVRVLLFTVQAGGVGIDMTAASTLVRLQRSYSMIDNVQALGRVHRIGSEIHSCINIIDIITPGTVEDDQFDRLREKEQRLESIVQDRAQLARAGQSIASLDSEYTMITGSNLLGSDDDDDHG